MSMSKKDFIALADVAIQAGWSDPDLSFSGEEIISLLADFCRTQNPMFKRDRWLEYIAGTGGPSGGRVKPRRPFTGARCSCRPGVERDNCAACEGTGKKIDFDAIRRA